MTSSIYSATETKLHFDSCVNNSLEHSTNIVCFIYSANIVVYMNNFICCEDHFNNAVVCRRTFVRPVRVKRTNTSSSSTPNMTTSCVNSRVNTRLHGDLCVSDKCPAHASVSLWSYSSRETLEETTRHRQATPKSHGVFMFGFIIHCLQ